MCLSIQLTSCKLYRNQEMTFCRNGYRYFPFFSRLVALPNQDDSYSLSHEACQWARVSSITLYTLNFTWIFKEKHCSFLVLTSCYLPPPPPPSEFLTTKFPQKFIYILHCVKTLHYIKNVYIADVSLISISYNNSSKSLPIACNFGSVLSCLFTFSLKLWNYFYDRECVV